MLRNEKIKGKIRQEPNFWFWNQAILHTILAEDEFNSHSLNLTNYTPPFPGSSQINPTKRAQHAAEGDRTKLAKETAILRPAL
jgi:hypothetical protein